MKSLCALPAGATISVQFAEGGRMFRRGDVVDLDEVIVPATKDRPAETWRDALGKHASAFVESADPHQFWAEDGPHEE